MLLKCEVVSKTAVRMNSDRLLVFHSLVLSTLAQTCLVVEEPGCHSLATSQWSVVVVRVRGISFL